MSRLAAWLRVASLLYLAVPAAIFLTGWLKLALAWPLTVLLAAGLAGFLRGSGRPAAEPEPVPHISIVRLGVAVVLATLPVILAGAGGVGIQTWDWVKHNAVLADLVARPWPVVYQTGADDVALVYYLAFYLPAALAGKLAGWAAANLVLFITTWAGAMLAMLWLVVFARGAAVAAALVFVLFSGMDAAGALVVNPAADWPALANDFHLEWWATHWQYSSNASLLYFVPQQALGAWLATALVIDAHLRGDRKLPMALLLALLALWSAFAAIGLLPLVAVLLWYRDGWTLRTQASTANLAGLMLGLVVLLFYGSRLLPFELPAAYGTAAGEPPPGALAWMPSRLSAGEFATSYSLFVSCEFLVLAALVAVSLILAGKRREVLLVLVATGILLALPLVRYGIYNDLVMRVSIPALFVLQACVLPVIRRSAAPLLARTAIIAVLGVGALYSANLLRIGVQAVHEAGHLVRVPDRAEVAGLPAIEVHPTLQLAFSSQYLGSARSLFYRHLAADAAALPVARPGPGVGQQ
ncbi:MAG TPA: hypothetical protein VK973_10380 [Arenicellales bacterium]|nr:hypothetical protein [Arenicellales bacterium]